MKIPKEFTLGDGHVKFFYDKLQYLDTRHKWLKAEYWKRFKKEWQFSTPTKEEFPKCSLFWKYYVATDRDRELLKERITSRILTMKEEPRYYRVVVPRDYSLIYKERV